MESTAAIFDKPDMNGLPGAETGSQDFYLK